MNSSKPLDFLFTTIDAGGNVAPVMTVVAKLNARGHRVRVMSDVASRKEVEAAGARFVSWKKAPSKPDRSPEAMRIFAANFELESAPIVGQWFTEAIRSVHPAQEAACELGPLDASRKPVITVSTVALAGSQEEASARYASLRSLPAGAKLVGEVVDQPASFQDLLQMVDGYFPNNARMAGDALWTATPVAELLPKLQTFAAKAPPAPSSIGLFLLGGSAKAPVGDKTSAFSQAGPMEVGVYGFWDDPAQDQTGRAWVRSVMQEVEPFSVGGYIGETDLAASPDRATRCFSLQAWDKLGAIRQKYDPEQLFHSYLTVG